MVDAHTYANVYTFNPPENPVEAALNVASAVGCGTDDVLKDEKFGGEQKPTISFLAPESRKTISYKFDLRDHREPYERLLLISFSEWIYPVNWNSSDDYRAFMDFVIELLRQISVTFDVEYLPLFEVTDANDVTPTGLPLHDTIERFPDFGIYSAEMIAEHGGIEKMLDHSPWWSSELENNRHLVITTPLPWHEANWHPSHSTE